MSSPNHQDGWRTGDVDILRPLGWTYDGSSDYSIGYADDPQANRIADIWDRNWTRATAYHKPKKESQR